MKEGTDPYATTITQAGGSVVVTHTGDAEHPLHGNVIGNQIDVEGGMHGTYANGEIHISGGPYGLSTYTWFCWSGKYVSSTGVSITLTVSGETVPEGSMTNGKVGYVAIVETPSGSYRAKVQQIHIWCPRFWGDDSTIVEIGTFTNDPAGVIAFEDNMHNADTLWTWQSA